MDKIIVDPKIRNRESWLKVIVISVFVLLMAWKFIVSPISFNFNDFSFPELLSLILAVFSISLSAAFYFKASEISNTFYDNTYKFTRDVSEILGRIEAGFGERLRHLDEGYVGLRDKFDQIPAGEINKAKKQVKDEETEIKKKEQERDGLIENLAQKAKLQEHEKDDLFKILRKKEDELLSAKRELAFFQRRLVQVDAPSVRVSSGRAEAFMRHFIRNRVIDEIGREIVITAPSEIIMKRFNSIISDFPLGFINDLKKFELLGSEGELNEYGVKVFREIAKSC